VTGCNVNALTHSDNECELKIRSLTIAFCYYLSNCIQTLLSTTDFKLDFYNKKRNSTKRLEEVSDSASISYAALEHGFGQIPKGIAKHSDKTIKDLRAEMSLL
jgi:hypothetical protein